MPDSAPSSVENSHASATDSTQSKQYPWQPRKPMAEPMASALRRAAEAAGKTEFENPPTGQATRNPNLSWKRRGSRACPRQGVESHSDRIDTLGTAKTASGKTGTNREQSAAEIWQAHSAAAKAEASEFATLDDTRDAFAAQPVFGQRWQQEGTRGSSRAPGSRRSRLFWLDQDAVAAGTACAAICRSRTNLSGFAASSPGDCGAGELNLHRQKHRHRRRTRPWPRPDQSSSSKPSAAVLAETPGSKTASPVAAKPAGIDNPVTSAQSSRSRDRSAGRAAVGKKR